MLVSSHPALAQFTQQGSKLVGTGASNPAFEGGSVNYRTPHTDKLHITERWSLTESGKTLEVTIRAEDAETFNDPWSAIRRYRRVQQPMTEESAPRTTPTCSTTTSRWRTRRISRTTLHVQVHMDHSGGGADHSLPAIRLLRESKKTSQALSDFKKHVDYVVWVILFFIGCGLSMRSGN